MNYKEIELAGLSYVLEHLDKNAVSTGDDSNQSDILLSDGSYVEVKKCKSQIGQFTGSTANKNPYSLEIMNGNMSEEQIKKWIYYHYAVNKKVKFFLIGDSPEEFQLLTLEEFFNNPKIHFMPESRCGKGKRSGSSHLPQCDECFIPKEWNHVREGKDFYCHDESFYGKIVFYYDKRGSLKRMQVSNHFACLGRINKLSDTFNPTWIFQMEASL